MPITNKWNMLEHDDEVCVCVRVRVRVCVFHVKICVSPYRFIYVKREKSKKNDSYAQLIKAEKPN